MNKATADALCVNVTGEADSLALVYGAAGSAELPYVNHAIFVDHYQYHCIHKLLILCVNYVSQRRLHRFVPHKFLLQHVLQMHDL